MALSKNITGNLRTVNASFKWEVDDKVINCSKVGDVLYSPEFHVSNSRWQLSFSPKHEGDDNKTFMSFFLRLLNCTKQIVKIGFIISILDKQGQKLKQLACSRKEFKSGNMWGFGKFFELHEFDINKNKLLVNNNLQFSVEITPCDNAYDEVLLNFEKLFDNEKFSDIKCALGDEKYLPAHKNILAIQSTVFSAMFEHDMKENIEKVIEIKDIDSEILVKMVYFMYTGKIIDIENVAQRLLIAADKYDLVSLKALCGEYLADTLSLENAVEYLSLADRHNINSLEIKAIHFIALNMKDLIVKPEFTAIADLEGSVILNVIRQMVYCTQKSNEFTNAS